MKDTIETLKETVRGRIVTGADEDYDEARAVYNAMHDRRPLAVIQCTDSADVMAVIAAGREKGLDLAIRGGGHSVPGFGTIDGGLVIDLSRMNSVRVDPVKKVARVGGGATFAAPIVWESLQKVGVAPDGLARLKELHAALDQARFGGPAPDPDDVLAAAETLHHAARM